MSSSQPDKRVDPLVDAYRQASDLEAQVSGAGPSAALRAAVLAHARVVAQSAATPEPKFAVSEAVRATPAANESKPVWRMVAGVVLGLAGMWVYQLTRPGTTGEANVAVLSAPQSAKATAAPVDKTAAPASPVADPPTSPRMQPEASVAVAAPVGPAAAGVPAPPAVAAAQTMRPAPLREREDSSARAGGSANSPTTVTRGVASGTVADATRSEASIAQAKIAAPLKKTESPAQMATSEAVATTSAVATAAPNKATGTATSAVADAAASEPMGEVAVASADTRKLARAGEARAPAAAVSAPAPVAAAPALATAPPPNAFPAVAAGAMAQSAPPPAAAAASPPPSFAASGNAAMRPGLTGAGTAPDAAMFSAIRAGNVYALRAAIARGANVNARDEVGRSPLQIARERNDADVLKVLELAGAK